MLYYKIKVIRDTIFRPAGDIISINDFKFHYKHDPYFNYNQGKRKEIPFFDDNNFYRYKEFFEIISYEYPKLFIYQNIVYCLINDKYYLILKNNKSTISFLSNNSLISFDKLSKFDIEQNLEKVMEDIILKYPKKIKNVIIDKVEHIDSNNISHQELKFIEIT